MQCPNGIANKNLRFTNRNDAMKGCNRNLSCFAIYDVRCVGQEYYMCENKRKWTKLTAYARESYSSCLYFTGNYTVFTLLDNNNYINNMMVKISQISKQDTKFCFSR